MKPELGNLARFAPPSVGGGLKPPGGGAPPPTHSWRICDRGLVLAGVLGVLGNLGILGKNLENIAPERSQIGLGASKIEPRGLQNRAWSSPRHHF